MEASRPGAAVISAGRLSPPQPSPPLFHHSSRGRASLPGEHFTAPLAVQSKFIYSGETSRAVEGEGGFFHRPWGGGGQVRGATRKGCLPCPRTSSRKDETATGLRNKKYMFLQFNSAHL